MNRNRIEIAPVDRPTHHRGLSSLLGPMAAVLLPAAGRFRGAAGTPGCSRPVTPPPSAAAPRHCASLDPSSLIGLPISEGRALLEAFGAEVRVVSADAVPDWRRAAHQGVIVFVSGMRIVQVLA